VRGSRFIAPLIIAFCAACCVAQTSRTVALTFDDLPIAVPGDDQATGDLPQVRHFNASILKTLTAHHAPAIGFVNERKLNVADQRDARAAVLRHWLTAGMELGNHTYSHLALSDVGVTRFEDDFVRGTVITPEEMRAFSKAEKYFRYPYLDTGKDKAQKDVIIAFYTARGFSNAPVTIQNQDWLFNIPYTDAVARHDAAAKKRVIEAYVEHTNVVLEYGEALARQSFGREIPQVMLLHVDALNADQLGAVLTAFERRGYRFISLDEALRDSAYATPDEYVGSDGVNWLERWQIALGKPYHPTEPLPPKWAQEDYRRITGKSPL
jgi:peptidoglycan/xylan/chitin deacetylase (PgdA/CDA1 family)